jgi:O-methyltransferase
LDSPPANDTMTALHKPIVKTYKDILVKDDPDDRAYHVIVNKIAPYTITLVEGLDATYALFQGVGYIARNRIPGAIAECGVWRGGSMMLAAHALRHFQDTSRELYLYDTYDGMTRPDDVDVDFEGNAMKTLWLEAVRNGKSMGFGGSLDTIKYYMRSTNYPEQQMRFVVGDVLETIPAAVPSQIALLRLDTDWYKSTLHELNHLYDLVVPRGIVIIDDYGWCRGAKAWAVMRTRSINMHTDRACCHSLTDVRHELAFHPDQDLLNAEFMVGC